MLNQLFTDIADKKGRLAIAAIAGTALLLVFMTKVAPIVLGQPMDPAAIVNKLFGLTEGASLGEMLHFLLALVFFPLGYMLLAFRFFPGPQFVRGLLYGLVLATIAGAVVFPLAGVPLFLGSPKSAMALYVVHLLYTGLMAVIIGQPSARSS
jgi:hypothetical protein